MRLRGLRAVEADISAPLLEYYVRTLENQYDCGTIGEVHQYLRSIT